VQVLSLELLAHLVKVTLAVILLELVVITLQAVAVAQVPLVGQLHKVLGVVTVEMVQLQVLVDPQ
jgi:hypothetical protein